VYHFPDAAPPVIDREGGRPFNLAPAPEYLFKHVIASQVKISPGHREKAFRAQNLLPTDEMSPAGQAQPRQEETQKVVANIFNMRHFTARSKHKVMINMINSS
jgi:hypothetical protein